MFHFKHKSVCCLLCAPFSVCTLSHTQRQTDTLTSPHTNTCCRFLYPHSLVLFHISTGNNTDEMRLVCLYLPDHWSPSSSPLHCDSVTCDTPVCDFNDYLVNSLDVC